MNYNHDCRRKKADKIIDEYLSEYNNQVGYYINFEINLWPKSFYLHNIMYELDIQFSKIAFYNCYFYKAVDFGVVYWQIVNSCI